MICKKCGQDSVVEEENRYVCKNCGAVAVASSNTAAIEQLSNDNNVEKLDKKGKPIKKKTPLQEVLEFCFPIVLALIIAIILKTLVFANAVVPTGSMLNTIQKKDRVIASRLAYINDDPERFDIIIFRYPDNEEQFFVKRIIGLPGETVTIVNGVVYVTDKNGETTQLRDDFVTNCVPTGNFGPYEVPEESYFVLGDNRNNSIDSRFWETTNYVSRDKIIGKVMFRYYPSISKIE